MIGFFQVFDVVWYVAVDTARALESGGLRWTLAATAHHRRRHQIRSQFGSSHGGHLPPP